MAAGMKARGHFGQPPGMKISPQSQTVPVTSPSSMTSTLPCCPSCGPATVEMREPGAEPAAASSPVADLPAGETRPPLTGALPSCVTLRRRNSWLWPPDCKLLMTWTTSV